MNLRRTAPALCLALVLRFDVAAAQDDPLAATLPSGKVVHFQTQEQKAQYEASLAKKQSNALVEREKAERQRVEEAAAWRERQQAKDLLESKKTDLNVTIITVRAPWVMVDASEAILSRDSETFKLVWKSAVSLPGYAYVEWTPPASAVDGETYHIVGYECGVLELNGSRYRRITTDEKRALQYFNDPKAVQWPDVK